jgi:ABC-type lipoprotein release transport system permease subunit
MCGGLFVLWPLHPLSLWRRYSRWPSESAQMTLIVRGGMTLAFWGIYIGIGGALVVSRLMRSLLFDVGVTDAVTFIAVPALLACIAFLASHIPTRRASRIDPSTSLRCE